MSIEELIVKACTVYDEYIPSQGLDEDLKTLIKNVLVNHTNDFLLLLPVSVLDNSPLLISTSGVKVNPIPYKGGYVVLDDLTNKFLYLVSFKHSEWERAVGRNEVIDRRSPRRMLQSSKYTAAGTAKPVVSIETIKNKKCLCFWGYKNSLSDIEEFVYIRRLTTSETGLQIFCNLSDNILLLYIHYCLRYLFETTRETELANRATETFVGLLATYGIDPQIPITFSDKGR